jgi:acetyl esterase/lipase
MSEDRSVLSREARDPDEELQYGRYPEQMLDVWHAEQNRPAVVFLHGGFWRPEYDRMHARPLGEALADEGWPVASIDYRREPGNPDSTADDVRDALNKLEDLMDLRAGFVLVGHSAGGQLALWAASTFNPIRLKGVVALAPVADLLMADRLELDKTAVQDFLGGGVRNDLDPTHLPAPIMPVSIVHGTADARVPIAVSESYAAAHPTARLVPVEGAGHFDLIDPLSDAWNHVTTEIARYAGWAQE